MTDYPHVGKVAVGLARLNLVYIQRAELVDVRIGRLVNLDALIAPRDINSVIARRLDADIARRIYPKRYRPADCERFNFLVFNRRRALDNVAEVTCRNRRADLI